MRRPRPAVAAAALALAAGSLAAVAVPAAVAQSRGGSAQARADRPKPFFDSRSDERRAVQRSGAQSLVAPRPATRAARIPVRGAIEVDPLTGTPRALAGPGGAPLTGPSSADPTDVATRYVREHLALLGLTEPDLATLHLQPRTTGAGGITAVRFSQLADGIPAFDNSLEVVVAADGSVVGVLGSPQHGLSLESAMPLVTAPEAMARLRENVGAHGTLPVESGPEGVRRKHEFKGGDMAELVAFGEGDATRLAWKVTSRGPAHAWYAAVVDAENGKLLYRANRTRSADEANVWEQYPGAPRGGTASVKSLTPYLNAGTNVLSGPYARAWSDLNDDFFSSSGSDGVGEPDAGEEISRTSGTFQFPFTQFTQSAGACSSSKQCSWNFDVDGSWRGNRARNGAQTFYFVNRFRDHLVSSPISFSAADGNFAGSSSTPGGDRVLVNTDDGAATDTANDRPDNNHVDNAFMSTPPDGQSPIMAMFLFFNNGDFRDVNGGDDAAIVYHEYTHGLSSRLITDGSGEQALNQEQSGSMGEGWSDWYAKDFLVDQFPADDTALDGDVDMGVYTDSVAHSIRTQGLDCPVGASASRCPGTTAQGSGGYTYGDFNSVDIDPFTGAHEVHQGGEIWAETLWDVRTAVGSAVAERVITQGMRQTPAEPSMLNARDAIISADHAIYGSNSHAAALWQAFAGRGMGTQADAGVITDPVPDVVTEDFNRPPTVSVTATPAQVDSGQDVDFDASGTVDPDGTVESYHWAFGDGSTDDTTEPATTHSYAANGTYTAIVTATDNDGGKEFDTVKVQVGPAPTPTPTPSPSPTPTPTPSPTPVPTVTPTPTPTPTPSAKPVISISRSGTKGRLRFSVRCDSACSGTAKLSISRKLAKKLGLGLGRKQTIVTRKVRLRAAGTKRYTLRLSRKVVRAMRREGVRRISTKLRVRVSDAESQLGSRTRAARIRR